jgi:hypothetical protein
MEKVPAVLELYGDESEFEDAVAYGIALVPVVLKAKIEMAISDAKLACGLPGDASIHCNELFRKESRETSVLAARLKTIKDVWAITEAVVDGFYAAGGRLWVGGLSTTKMPTVMPIEAPSGKVELVKTHLSHARLFAYWAASAPCIDMAPHTKIRSYLDPDRVSLRKNPFLGRLKQQIRDHQGFFPANHGNVRFEPERITGDTPSLVEMADIIAYAASHRYCARGHKDSPFFEALLNRGNVGVSTMHFLDVTGPVCSAKIETESTLQTQKAYFAQFVADDEKLRRP